MHHTRNFFPVFFCLTVLVNMAAADLIWSGATADLFDDAQWGGIVDLDSPVNDNLFIHSGEPQILNSPGCCHALEIGDGFTLKVDQTGFLNMSTVPGYGLRSAGTKSAGQLSTLLIEDNGRVDTYFFRDIDAKLSGNAILNLDDPDNVLVGLTVIDLNSFTCTLNFLQQSPSIIESSYLGRLTVFGEPAILGVNISIISDGANGSIITALANGDVLAGPILNPANGHQYFLLNNANWTDSEAAAVHLGGHLVTINNAVENQWVFDTFAGFGGEDRMLWIGLNDLQHQGVYEWSSGEQVTYTNWETGQPSSAQERWVLMYPDNITPDSFPRLPGTWNDFRDSDVEFISGDQYFLYGVVEVGGMPSTLDLVPQLLLVTRGIYVSGGTLELAASDNSDLSIQRASTDTLSRTEFEVEAVSPITNPTSLQVTLEGSVFARSQVDQMIELFNYFAFPSGAWETVDTRAASRFTDSTVTVAATGDLSRFVEPGTMCMKARVRYQSPVARQLFSSNTDQFIWTIGQ